MGNWIVDITGRLRPRDYLGTPLVRAGIPCRLARGRWEQLESYVHQRTNAEFSHGLCRECAQAVWGAKG